MKIKVLLVILISLIFFLGCDGFSIIPILGNKSNTNLILRFDTEESRTILPEVSSNITEYKITCSGPEVKALFFTTGSSLELELLEGVWNIDVEALNSNAEIIAYGYLGNIEITSGTVIDRTVNLNPIQNEENTGNIDIEITWPVTQQIDNSSTVVLNGMTYEIGTSYPETTFNITDQTMTFQGTDIISGNYIFIASLNLNNNMQTTVSESIQVYDNLTSSAIIELSIDDFTLAPGKSVITSSIAENNQIILNWENLSAVVTTYTIERSLSESTGYSLLAMTDGLTISYSDSDVDSMTTYYYRIIASSTGGDSEPSDSIGISIEPPEPGNNGIIECSDITNTSLTLSWIKATDNISSQNSLMYKIVISETSNISSILDAENNGITIEGWLTDIDTRYVSGLTPGATYYFNILVRDEAGNIQLYSMKSVTLTSVGELDFTILIIEPGNESITFSESNDIPVPHDSILTLTTIEGFDSYQWYLDGIVVNDQIDNIFEFDCNTIDLGVHHLTVFVSKNGLIYSNSIRFYITPSEGQISLTITVNEPLDEIITFSESDDIAVSQDGTLALTITEEFDSYQWYIDGLIIENQTTNSIAYNCTGILLGVHQLTIFVTKNEMLYSKTIRFIIQN